MLPPGSQRRAMKFLRQKANRGLGYAKDRVQNAHDAVDGAAARAGKVIDQVSEGLDSARRVISKVERLRNA
jgi:hypothetical protein